jgi:hypothetical protein
MMLDMGSAANLNPSGFSPAQCHRHLADPHSERIAAQRADMGEFHCRAIFKTHFAQAAQHHLIFDPAIKADHMGAVAPAQITEPFG